MSADILHALVRAQTPTSQQFFSVLCLFVPQTTSTTSPPEPSIATFPQPYQSPTTPHRPDLVPSPRDQAPQTNWYVINSSRALLHCPHTHTSKEEKNINMMKNTKHSSPEGATTPVVDKLAYIFRSYLILCFFFINHFYKLFSQGNFLGNNWLTSSTIWPDLG